MAWARLALGGYVFAAPWQSGSTDEPAVTWNALVVGAAIIGLALTTLAHCERLDGWFDCGLAGWLIASPLLLDFSSNLGTALTTVLPGLALAALAAITLWMDEKPPAAN